MPEAATEVGGDGWFIRVIGEFLLVFNDCS
jgi:hypothetical protein